MPLARFAPLLILLAGVSWLSCSGDYLAGALKSDTAVVRVTGSGTCRVSVTGTLNASILGSGDVLYSGTPKVNASIAGSGNVNQVSE